MLIAAAESSIFLKSKYLVQISYPASDITYANGLFQQRHSTNNMSTCFKFGRVLNLAKILASKQARARGKFAGRNRKFQYSHTHNTYFRY